MKTTMKMLVMSAVLTTLTGCVAYEGDGYYTNDPPPPPPPPAATWHPVTEFASSATASSESANPGSADYSVVQALGEPDVNACADDPRAWSPAYAEPKPGVTYDGDPIDDFLEVTFDQPLAVNTVRIYETYAPGVIVAVTLESSFGAAAPITLFEDYYGDGPAPCPSAFVLSLGQDTIPDAYDRVVIFMDTNLVYDANKDGTPDDDFNAIDAVELDGDLYY